MAIWVRDPHAGGAPISGELKQETQQRLLEHARKHYKGATVDIRFRGSFCYVDAYDGSSTKARKKPPLHLCRLRYCGRGQWSVAFFAYSSEKYEATTFASGRSYGTVEEGLDVGAVYLQPQTALAERKPSGSVLSELATNKPPKSNHHWLREIAAAYNDAREAMPFGPLVGTEVREADLFQLAPSVCLKYRGVPGSKKTLKKATDAALISYVATKAQEPEVFAKPYFAFAFCYLAAHLGLGILSEEEIVAVMDFVVEHERLLVRMLDGEFGC